MRITKIIFLLPLVLVIFSARHSTTVESLPPVVLWAWERPENLTFLDPKQAAVAFLAKTITLRDDKIAVKPRLQPLRVAPETKLIAVVRIETDRANAPTLSSAQLQQTAREISSFSGVSVVQIDFDAKVSERDFYRKLLQRVRYELSPSVALSITALASWCAGDHWIADLPVDEAVPMLFRMGVERPQFQRRLESGQPFEATICRNSAGVSTDEPITAPDVDRLYIFNPQPWTKDSFARAMEAYRR
jgi:Protein of unknown function (DUF3142)